MEKRFNIRVYGIWVNDGRLLVNEELIRGNKIIKLPGGGMDWGEGTRDCLKREWQEELGIDIEVGEHFYTTDYFQPSAFDNSQVMSIYYLVSANPDSEIKNLLENERTYWMPLSEVSADSFTLPIDRIVGGMIKQQFANKNY
jgi:ADP-ribose pyrophosphatase YjhB (NUDIX family)